jgi:hypothetical protein
VTWAIWPGPSLLPISFRAAASKFGVALSALNHSMRQLAGRLGVQLLTSGQVVVDNLAEAQRHVGDDVYSRDDFEHRQLR